MTPSTPLTTINRRRDLPDESYAQPKHNNQAYTLVETNSIGRRSPPNQLLRCQLGLLVDDASLTRLGPDVSNACDFPLGHERFDDFLMIPLRVTTCRH